MFSENLLWEIKGQIYNVYRDSRQNFCLMINWVTFGQFEFVSKVMQI